MGLYFFFFFFIMEIFGDQMFKCKKSNYWSVLSLMLDTAVLEYVVGVTCKDL